MVEADPALSRDDLPQPYRMIWKVIDEYILDPMWLEITRIHPELLQDEEGKAFCTPHNQALQNICTPSAVTEQEFTFTSVLEREGLLFMSTDSGAFVVMDPEDNSILQSIRVVEEETPKTAEQLEAEAAAAAADPKAKKGASPVDAAPPKPHRVTNMWISDASLPISDERLMNFSVVSIVEVEEAPPAEEGKKKGEVEEMLRVPKCVVTIVQAVLGMTEGYRSSLITLSVVGETVVPLEAAQVSSIGRIDISPNGCLMAASTSLGCSVYQLPVKIGRSRTKIGNVEQIVESEGGGVREETEVDLKREEEDTEDDVNKTRPALEVVLSLNQDFFGGRKVKSVKFFPLCMGHERKTKRERDDAAAATAAAAALPPVPEGGDGESKGGEGGTPTPPGGATGENYYHTAMTVVFEEASEWWILGMKGLADLALASNGKTQGGVACADAVAACKLFSWSLPSSGSAFALDSDRSIVAIGSRDGTVCMWNLTTRALTSVMGRHETPVSTICFLQAPSGMSGSGAVDHFMVSGADDGTVCLYQLSIPPKAKSGVATDLFAKEGGAPGGDSACITSRFINYRMDVNAGTSIVGIRSIPGLPWAMVSCSDGMCMVYDVPNAQLLGRLALYSGMTSRQVDWKIMNFEEVISYKAPPQPLPAAQDETDGQLGGEEMGQQQQQQQQQQQEEEKKDDTDPNLFVRLPPGQRPLKFSVASQFDWGRFELLNSIAGPSRSSFHCVYQRSGLPVLASFRAEDLITNFYPELAQGLNKKIQTSLASLDLLQAFKRLSSHERQDPELAISNMINFSQNFMDSLEPASGQNSSRSAAIPVRTGTTGTNRRSAGGNNGGKKSRNGSSAGATTITKTNLDALQSALGGSASGEGVAGGKGALGASILTASHERVVDPAAAATTSARSSKADRAARKHRLLNRLSSVSAAL